ncbi:uncharacterized protein LOC127002505 [Eriocheir sinensis]|uniref:uncharacterized protein LOC127002505 n=1 Tax=Eriocheir sinensis TaxID=95602 RepID=UPI0021CA226F|nr:uncharacterized protein LOC127002505 [Eriocheir sinensis]
MYKGIVLYCSHALSVILPSLPCCRIMSEGGSRGDVAMRADANVHRPGVTPEEMAAGYDEWSENYEEMMIWKGGYRGPAITLEEALRWVPPERRAKARVLDVAAGTGCVGRELHREGFRWVPQGRRQGDVRSPYLNILQSTASCLPVPQPQHESNAKR